MRQIPLVPTVVAVLLLSLPRLADAEPTKCRLAVVRVSAACGRAVLAARQRCEGAAAREGVARARSSSRRYVPGARAAAFARSAATGVLTLQRGGVRRQRRGTRRRDRFRAQSRRQARPRHGDRRSSRVGVRDSRSIRSHASTICISRIIGIPRSMFRDSYSPIDGIAVRTACAYTQYRDAQPSCPGRTELRRSPRACRYVGGDPSRARQCAPRGAGSSAARGRAPARGVRGLHQPRAALSACFRL